MRRRTLSKANSNWWEDPQYEQYDFVGEFYEEAPENACVFQYGKLVGYTTTGSPKTELVSLKINVDPITKRFWFNMPSDINWNYISPFFRENTWLKAIYRIATSLSPMYWFNDCSNLQYLDMRSCTSKSDIYITNFLVQCRALQTIFFPLNTRLNGWQGASNFFYYSPNIEIIGCSKENKGYLQNYGGQNMTAAPDKWQDGGAGKWIIYD